MASPASQISPVTQSGAPGGASTVAHGFNTRPVCREAQHDGWPGLRQDTAEARGRLRRIQRQEGRASEPGGDQAKWHGPGARQQQSAQQRTHTRHVTRSQPLGGSIAPAQQCRTGQRDIAVDERRSARLDGGPDPDRRGKVRAA